jgi:hypothetical protein
MGTLNYGDATSATEFEDRLLAHLQLVIITKLRRSESFVFSWDVPRENGSGYNAIWISPTVPLRFTYPAGKRGPINRAWVEAMLHAANSVAGLRIVDEPEASVESPAQAPE